MKLKHLTLATCVSALSLCMISCGNNDGKDSGSGSAARLEYAPQQNVVDVMKLERTAFHNQLISNGKLSAASRSSLNFSSSGTISDIRVEDGSLVNKGDTVAVLFMENQQLALNSAVISLKKAELDLYDFLARQGYLTKDTASVPDDILAMAKMRSGYDDAVNNYRKAENDLKGCVITVPFGGRIADLDIRQYDRTTSEPACTLINDSELDVKFSILESEYPFIEKGLTVKVIPYADRSITATGTVRTVNPAVDKNGQITVTASIRNNGKLIDGMNVKVIVEKDVPGQLVVPRSAVVIRDNQEVLFRYSGGKAVWTYVNVLMSNSDSHSVTANKERGAELSEGDMIITSGNLNIADGTEVTIKDGK